MPSRLKSLELNGFKTFAVRTEFEFAGSITAVVGPNGSGKSNIADAIRWVLGEQSYSLLRAKKTEDMIFSGSEQRSKVGMASASIIFDNEAGWLPIEFSEVSIARRAYRDGQNEYLINGQKVRLKDVTELLAKSGLAERTYTIIGQGLVDSALSLKAGERRKLFEEAAGIGLYRSRRDEAIRRLDTTRRNLERVQDILVELRPRLRSLERQARRAQEFERVKADLQIVLREWYGYHWHHIQKDLTEAQLYASDQDKSLTTIRLTHGELDLLLVSSIQQIKELREKLGQLHLDLSQLHAKREQIARNHMLGEERIRSLNAQMHNINLEINRLRGEIIFQAEIIDSAKENHAVLLQDHKEAQIQVDQQTGQFEEMRRQQNVVEQEVLSLEKERTNLTASHVQINAKISEKKELIDRLTLRMEKMGLEIGKIREEITGKERLLKKAEKLVSDNKTIQKTLREQKDMVEADITKTKTLINEVNDRRSELHNSSARFRTQLEVLNQADRGMVGFSEGSKILLIAAQESQLSGVIGPLNREIVVLEEHETAITAALGPFVDSILIENQDEIENALKYLDEKQVRSAILPVNEYTGIQDTVFDILVKEEGFIGFADQLVTCSQELTPILKILVGRSVVVRDREVCMNVKNILKSNNMLDWKVVTLKGEVFYVRGPILVGNDVSDGVISRPRQKREIQDKLSKINEAGKELDKNLRSLESNLSKLAERDADLQKNIHLADDNLANSIEEYNQEKVNLETYTRTLEFNEDQYIQTRDEISAARVDVSEMGSNLGQYGSKIGEVRNRLQDYQSKLDSISLHEAQSQLSFWKTRLAVATQALEDSTKRIGELEDGRERVIANRDQLENRKDETNRQLEGSQQQIEVDDKSEGKIDEEIQLLQKSIEPLETKLAVLEDEYEHLQEREIESRKALSQAEHAVAQAEINLIRRKEALTSLMNKIEDDFGLVDYEYTDQVSGPTPLPLDGFVEDLPLVSSISPDLEDTVKMQRVKLRRIGPINPEVNAEYDEVKDRYEFLVEQVADLKKAEEDINEVIAEMDLIMEREFQRTFKAVAHEFHIIFTRLFGGGSARLVLTEPDNFSDTGIDIEARLPGRREQGLSLLSGGERSLTASALVFALLKVSPTPFCVFDEVDAMLDEANVGRFRELLQELSLDTQFVIITHNRSTVQAADVIYGVTMGSDTASQVISLRLEHVSEVVE